MKDRMSSGRLPLSTAGLLLGLGIGGFFDGIVLHQILQWHHMVSNVWEVSSLEGLQINTLADGIFHIIMWFLLLAGLILHWRDREPASPRALAGSLLVGWGLFNVIDEILNHRLLNLHHIKPGPHELVYDLGFAFLGLILAAIGWYVLHPPGPDRPDA